MLQDPPLCQCCVGATVACMERNDPLAAAIAEVARLRTTLARVNALLSLGAQAGTINGCGFIYQQQLSAVLEQEAH